MEKLLVIGGCNIDYIGKSISNVIYEDSNVGDISISFGGVSRNIVENVARLGSDITFITAIGDDVLGKAMHQELVDLGVKVHMPKVVNQVSGGYLAIHDYTGKMHLALCTQEVTKAITIEYLDSLDEIISSHDYIVIDTNFDINIIHYLVNRYKDKTIFLDVISTAKGKKILGYESYINYLKCNDIEAESLFGKEYFKNFNENTLIVTRGADSILYNTRNEISSSKVERLEQDEIVNVTGAGDAFFSGFIFGKLNGYDMEKCLEIGKRLSHLTLKSQGACFKGLTINHINDLL